MSCLVRQCMEQAFEMFSATKRAQQQGPKPNDGTSAEIKKNAVRSSSMMHETFFLMLGSDKRSFFLCSLVHTITQSQQLCTDSHLLR